MTNESASQTAIDAFLDALWIEEGLAANTLAAYRRDLTLYAQWLQAARDKLLDASGEDVLVGDSLPRHHETLTTTATRRLAVFRRSIRWAVSERFQLTRPLWWR